MPCRFDKLFDYVAECQYPLGITTPSTPAETKAARTRRRILDAAASTFAEHGYKGASIARIAAAARLQHGSLYFHFADKDALIGEVLREGVERSLVHVRQAVDELPPDATGRERLRCAVHAHLQALHQLSDHAAAVLRIIDEVPPPVRARQAHVTRAYAGYWDELIAAAQADGTLPPQLDLLTVRDLLFAAMNGTAGPSPRPRHTVDQLTDTLIVLVCRL